MKRILSPLLAAALVSPMAFPVMAQDSDVEIDSPAVDGTMEADTIGVDGEMTPSGDDASADGMSAEADALIVTVGDAEITASEVQAAIQGFPPQLAQQVPPEQLVSVAVDQLVLRELILQRAAEENLAEDPEVQQIVEENGQRSQEDAIVQVYVQRAMDESISDEAVQTAYDEADAQTEQELPTIEEVRPQIEQQLRQERLAQLRQELVGQGTPIVFYDESGNPVEDTGAMPGNTDSGSDSAESADSGSEDTDGNTANDAEAGDSEED